MKNQKYYLYLTDDERSQIICSLIDLKNDLIRKGKYTDIIDELIIRFSYAKKKKIKVKIV